MLKFSFPDSKQLTEQKREQLLLDMLSNDEWIVGGVHVISPVFISEKMLDRSVKSAPCLFIVWLPQIRHGNQITDR